MAQRAMVSKREVIPEENLFVDYNPAPVKRRTVTPELCANASLGRINVLYGTTGSGKTSYESSLGYLNLIYKPFLEEIKCPKVIKCMQKGILPEINKIGIIDADLKFLLDMEDGDWKRKYRPLVEKEVFELDEFHIMRTQEIKNGQRIEVIDPGIEEEKREFESAIINNLRDPDIDLVVIDSMSDYVDVLNDKLDMTYWDNENAWEEGKLEGLKVMQRKMYGKRAKWYFNMLGAIRKAKKPTFLSFQVSEIPSAFRTKREAGKHFDTQFEDPAFNIRWVNGTGYKVDNVYHCQRDYMRDKYKIMWKKGPWRMTPNVLDIPNDPFNFMHVLEASADTLLGEYDREAFDKGEKFW